MVQPTFDHEQQLWAKGYRYVAGVDEVGRGAWAGPLVAAAVIFPGWLARVASAEGVPSSARRVSADVGRDEPTAGPALLKKLRDSKLLSPAQRERLDPLIKEQAITWAIGEVSVAFINGHGIAAATQAAMQLALKKLELRPDFHLIDYFKLQSLPADRQLGLTRGDTFVASIAAASVIAKVYRDRWMVSCHRSYPRYGFDRHKGYGTLFHRQALKRFGPCPLHRRAFID